MNVYDCHGGPGTTEPACGACVTCLHRVIEQKDQRIKRLEEAGDAMERRLERFSSGGLDTSGRADRQPASIEGLVVADFRLVDQAIQQWTKAKEATP